VYSVFTIIVFSEKSLQLYLTFKGIMKSRYSGMLTPCSFVNKHLRLSGTWRRRHRCPL